MSSGARRNQTDSLDTAPCAYSTSIKVRVELFGLPRLRAGLRELELELAADVTRHQLIEALAGACPALVGRVLKEDLSDLQEGYVFNRNGVAFLGGGPFRLEAGDSLLLLSNQAGG